MGKGNKLLLLFAGFCDLSQDDQLILIKVGFFEIWLGHVARLISDSSLTFADGTYITRQQMDLMYDVRHHISNKLYWPTYIKLSKLDRQRSIVLHTGTLIRWGINVKCISYIFFCFSAATNNQGYCYPTTPSSYPGDTVQIPNRNTVLVMNLMRLLTFGPLIALWMACNITFTTALLHGFGKLYSSGIYVLALFAILLILMVLMFIYS